MGDNIKKDLREMGWWGEMLKELSQDRGKWRL
jgi:hypothetical protein